MREKADPETGPATGEWPPSEPARNCVERGLRYLVAGFQRFRHRNGRVIQIADGSCHRIRLDPHVGIEKQQERGAARLAP